MAADPPLPPLPPVPPVPPVAPFRRPGPWRIALGALAIIVVVGLGLLGIGMAGYLVLMLVAVNSFGSNK